MHNIQPEKETDIYDSTVAPPPLMPPEKHSRIGIASFGIGILAVLMICLAILLAFGYGFPMAATTSNFQVDQSSPFWSSASWS
ncbi:MAG TPA: hypothetical protein VF352_08495 [Anaerolineales bacterium]